MCIRDRFLGLAQAGTTYAMIFGIIGRHIAANQRSMAMGITAAAGSFGQFLMLPIDHLLIGWLNWQNALVFCAFLALLIMPMALYLGENGSKNAASTASRLATGPSAPSAQLKAWPALRQALAAPSFRWLMVGYFVCGFQVVFIGVHLPTFLRDARLPDHVAVTCLALVGLLNIVGTWLAGWLGQHYDRRYILAGIYAGRALVIAIFIALPLSALSAYVFAAVMGILWLSTVPPTNAIVVHRFGPRHFSMLSGFVFFAHQLGSTTGVWLAGWLYDLSHSYTVMWWCSIALGVMAAGANLRIRRQDAQ